MNAQTREQILAELPRIMQWWRRNAKIRHGHVPDPYEEDLLGEDESKAGQKLPPANPSWSLWSLVRPLALLAALSGAGAAGYYLAGDGDVAPPPTPETGSLYQWLEDEGLHVSP